MRLSSSAPQRRVVLNLKSLWTTILILNLNKNITDQLWKVRPQRNCTSEKTVLFNKIIIRAKLITIKR